MQSIILSKRSILEIDNQSLPLGLIVEQKFSTKFESFINNPLIARAFVHSSYEAEHPRTKSNERLEFLGDAVLDLYVAHFLHENYPRMKEGDMAKVRAATVSKDSLAVFSRELQLFNFLQLGKSEKEIQCLSDSTLADTFEALIGAIFLTYGLNPTYSFLDAILIKAIRKHAKNPGNLDYKTRLQEIAAQLNLGLPNYKVKQSGPDHDKTFFATVKIAKKTLAKGVGKSKKNAEREAARAAIEKLVS